MLVLSRVKMNLFTILGYPTATLDIQPKVKISELAFTLPTCFMLPLLLISIAL